MAPVKMLALAGHNLLELFPPRPSAKAAQTAK